MTDKFINSFATLGVLSVVFMVWAICRTITSTDTAPAPSTYKLEPYNPFIIPSKAANIQSLVDIVTALPNSPLKSNLMAVIGTEYAGGSVDLNNALKEFIQNQIRMLEREAAGTNKDL